MEFFAKYKLRHPIMAFKAKASGQETGPGIMLRVDVLTETAELTPDMVLVPVGDLWGRTLVRWETSDDVKGYFSVPSGHWKMNFEYIKE